MRTYALDVIDAVLQKVGPHVPVIRRCMDHRAAAPQPDRFEWTMLKWFVALTVVSFLAAVVAAPFL